MVVGWVRGLGIRGGQSADNTAGTAAKVSDRFESGEGLGRKARTWWRAVLPMGKGRPRGVEARWGQTRLQWLCSAGLFRWLYFLLLPLGSPLSSVSVSYEVHLLPLPRLSIKLKLRIGRCTRVPRLTDIMDALFLPIAEATGGSIDQIKVRNSPLFAHASPLIPVLSQLIACILFSYPLGSLYIRIPTSHPELKHLFSVLISFFYLVPVLQLWSGAMQLLFSVVATYHIVRRVQARSMPWLVFL